jgi:putative transcriptional regulator
MEGKTLTLFEDLMTGLDEVDVFLAGKTTGYRVTLPAEVDVKAIRKRLNMTQSRFSDTFGFSLDAVKHWEGGRRTPESSARAFLTVIAKDPKAVISALHQPAQTNATRVAAAKKGRWRRPKKTEVSARPSAKAR